MLTAMLQAKLEDRSTSPASSGNAETLIPCSRRASVTLKSGASKIWDATNEANDANRKDRMVVGFDAYQDGGESSLNKRSIRLYGYMSAWHPKD
jgi:hypothetical protein